jgi:hypothetical protein
MARANGRAFAGNPSATSARTFMAALSIALDLKAIES